MMIVTNGDELPSRWRELVQIDTLVGNVDTGGSSLSCGYPTMIHVVDT